MNEGFLVTKYFDNLRLREYEAYNEKCKGDLQQMNENKIDNIIARGGTEGWDTIGELDALSKTFQFETFEQANYFVHQVGIFAETKDHHPEWSIKNGGRDVTVRLTSHFANNKVTLFDFELAQSMNTEFKRAAKFNAFPRFTSSQYVSAAVAVGSAVFLFGSYRVLTDNEFIFDLSTLYKQAPVNQKIEGESEEDSLAFAIH